MKTKRTYSTYSNKAMSLLGSSIRAARKEKKMSESELAERAGVARSLVQRIEKGDMTCGIGSVFELAYIVDIPLFGLDKHGLASEIAQVENKLTLLPKAIRNSNKSIDDNF